jgi:hypothetical protein
MVIFVKKKYLAHYGIKGMRWGIRRFENADGTLTPAGKRRYKNPDGTLTPAGKRRYNKGGKTEPDYSKLSDQELRTKVNRLNMERQYSQLMNPPTRVKRGAEYAREMLQTIGATLAVTATAATLYIQLKSGKTGAQQVSNVARTASKLAGNVSKVVGG